MCGVVEGDEKPIVCGVVEGEDESWPESDIFIIAEKKKKKDMLAQGGWQYKVII